MNVLCAIGARGGAELVEHAVRELGSAHAFLLLHVVDAGPRHTFEELVRRVHGRRPPPPPPPPGPERGGAPMTDAERGAGEAALAEARAAAERSGARCEVALDAGRPEAIIVERARSWPAALVVLQASAGEAGRPRIGPASVGHTARFVVDHAPCDVLLVRGLAP